MRYSVKQMLIIVALCGGISWGIAKHVEMYRWWNAGCPGGHSPDWVTRIVERLPW